MKRLIRLLKLAYIKLVRINDTPQKVALGFGLGVFAGIMPGFGTLLGLLFAFILKANSASVLIAALLTNTWFTVLAIIPAIKLGSGILGWHWSNVYSEWALFIKDFHWVKLIKPETYRFLLPVIIGYLVISVLAGILAYAASLAILRRTSVKK